MAKPPSDVRDDKRRGLKRDASSVPAPPVEVRSRLLVGGGFDLTSKSSPAHPSSEPGSLDYMLASPESTSLSETSESKSASRTFPIPFRSHLAGGFFGGFRFRFYTAAGRWYAPDICGGFLG